ncbi:MAG: DUF4439 domain-containing protein [Dermatophilaceae bacterium]
MSANDSMPSLWSRRGLLAALAAGSVMALSGCRVQLEEDAPRIPLVPARVPMKDEKTLLAMLENTRSLGSLATSVPGGPRSTAGRLSSVHDGQVAVLERLLREGGVPETLLGSLPAGVLSRPVLSPPVLPLAVLSAAESASVNDLSLAGLADAHVALMGSLLAQRRAAVNLLGGSVAPVAPADLGGAQVVALLAAVRSAVYGFEVVAAHIEPKSQSLATTTLSSLRERASELEKLTGSPPPTPLGYVLPFSVTDPKSARRLALHVLNALLSDQAAALEPAAGDANALATLTHWLGQTEAVASRWGAPLAAFPGLTEG